MQAGREVIAETPIVQKALDDLLNNRTRPISSDEEFANYVEEEINKLKSQFDNAKTFDELDDLYFNELNNLPKNLDEEYIVAEISKSFKENEQRLENEQRQNNESTPRNANEISEPDIGRSRADTGGLIQENTNQQQGQNQEINPDTKLNQLKNTPKQEKVHRGAYDVSAKAIELFKDADYSTLPHELAHFWLDNMWGYYRSGKASEGYSNNFKGVLDWLGVKDYQTYFTKAQQEKFARGYEKYLLNGYAPNGLIQGAFDDYDKWLQKVQYFSIALVS